MSYKKAIEICDAAKKELQMRCPIGGREAPDEPNVRKFDHTFTPEVVIEMLRLLKEASMIISPFEGWNAQTAELMRKIGGGK